MEDSLHEACHVRHHVGCIRAGTPFFSRCRDAKQGLTFNPKFADFPFVCEHCTVRANARRGLNATHPDMQLLMLERMRMVDCSNAWAQGTLQSIAGSLRTLRRFTTNCRMPWGQLKASKPIRAPPHGPSIILLWTMEWHTLQQSSNRSGERVRHNTARHLRFALHSLLAWEGTLLPEGTAFRVKDRLHLPPLVSASGSLVVQLTTSGMERRLGTHSNPSVALQATHVRQNIAWRQETIDVLSGHPAQQRQLHLAQLAEALLWLGWLRGSEVFSLRWMDVELVKPCRTPKHGLPPGPGALLLRLLEAAKSNQTQTTDHIIAHTSGSGFAPGPCFENLLTLRPADTPPSEHVFTTETGQVWNSCHFRETHVCPGLKCQWLEGDPLLRTHAPRSAEDVAKKFHSLHSCRRGGRTHVSKKRAGCSRKATQLEVLDHGRWRRRCQTQSDMPTHCQETALEDRLCITLLCMQTCRVCALHAE